MGVAPYIIMILRDWYLKCVIKHRGDGGNGGHGGHGRDLGQGRLGPPHLSCLIIEKS